MTTVEGLIRPTPQDKGVELTVKVTVYDTGLIMVGPPSPPPGTRARVFNDDNDRWFWVIRAVMRQLEELQRQAHQRTRLAGSR